MLSASRRAEAPRRGLNARSQHADEWIALVRGLGSRAVWTTLTFREELSAEAAMARFEQSIRGLARHLKRHLWVAYAWEPQRRGTLHFHVFLWAARSGEAVSIQAVQDAWRQHGHEHTVEYHPGGGAAPYSAAHANLAINCACPRRNSCRRGRRAGGACRVAGMGWRTPLPA